MGEETLEDLLEKLCAGDEAAAERVFVAYEPYLRVVVRRLLPARLRTKFDSVDVVQSVWADVLSGFRTAGWRFRTMNHLQAFLVKATRNRFIDRVRQHQKAADREQPLEAGLPGIVQEALGPRPSQVVEADELWQQMLTLCPPAHHELLRLKRQGFSLSEISTRTGLHESSVRRILYDLARRMAFREQAGSGE